MTLDRLHDAMAARVANDELPGLVTVIAHGDDVHVDAIGLHTFGGLQPMRRDTVFRIASLTKPIVAAATMMLVEDGMLALDEPVDRLLPELANRRVLTALDAPVDDTVPADRPITVEDLLTLRMGHGLVFEPTFQPPIPVIALADELQLVMGAPDPRTPHTPDEWIKLFGGLPLMRQPGERWQYNTGSLVLGVLVARVTGQPLGEVLRTRIFAPLDMAETGFSVSADLAARMPAQYTTDLATGEIGVEVLAAPEEWMRPPAFPSGAAGLVSTADDFLAFARMLARGGRHGDRQLLSEESVRQMTTNHLTPEQIASGGVVLGGRGWGYGMGVVHEPDEVSEVPGRYGWSGGYGTSWFNDPATGVTAILLTQVSDVLFDGTLTEFGRLADH
jgi:CubicO group peptidase (beta-lactamase class C family)